MYPGRGKWVYFDGRPKVSPLKKREEVTDGINSATRGTLNRDSKDNNIPFSQKEKKGLHAKYVESRTIQGANVNQLVDVDDTTCKKSKGANEVRKPIDSSTLSSTMKSNANGRLEGKIGFNTREVGGIGTSIVGTDKFQHATATSISNAQRGGCMEDLGGWDGLDEEEGAKQQRDRTLQARINTLIQNSEAHFKRKHELDAWDM